MKETFYKSSPTRLRAIANLLVCILFFTACRGGHTQATSGVGDTLKIRHAEYLTMIEYVDYTEVQIHNPWSKGKLLQTVRIESSQSPSRSLFFTATHSSLIEELGCIESIAGICEAEYIANPRLRKAITEGHIKNMGSAMTPDRERIVSLTPDIILLSPYENASTYGNLESLGIPIIQCADYMETSPLGRAEWCKFYGRLFNSGEKADLFPL